ncbi:MAG: sigma-54-dependent Fis family transcriptional regulator, partial [Gammaproteobacteria bacterium]|nr:sigma-54-dependent Fis family transcriptional regulator [Gammaproteobacteria bacterium]NIR84103.1 sigma-54-dependent Fis family transcriptional regulator [Gammaproteobacteria bacterium]NIU05266.1 sigma-54-dependent Fis family transcriptional regulator [Gammaproteobacteria bacterium]NIV52213.1 response regulator [Gammaproteobacteria bacterium]NIV74573.1 response regulator [Gammaproteobacteria bacterium]
MSPEVCLVEDDPILGDSLQERLQIEGFCTEWFRDADAAFQRLHSRRFDAVISDVRLPDMSGIELFQRLLRSQRHTPPVLFITAYGSIDDAVKLLKLGAADYVTKPLDPDALVSKLQRICRVHGETDDQGTALGISAPMRELAARLPTLARHHQTPVLIVGESGSGKEVLARRLHDLQAPTGRFVALNCAAVPEHLIETELFGHERGAFTGANSCHKGVFEQADCGTLFLDEIGDMPLPMQAKLLRVVQERALVRVGGEQLVPVRSRLMLATYRDLRVEVEAGRFREDLYYRVHVITVRIPPLRERREDILWLVERFLEAHAQQYPDERKTLSEAARRTLLAHDWPGNVRELKHTLERACILSAGPALGPDDLFPESAAAPGAGDDDLAGAVQQAERERIVAALSAHDW